MTFTTTAVKIKPNVKNLLFNFLFKQLEMNSEARAGFHEPVGLG